jgi:hypothetical protein
VDFGRKVVEAVLRGMPKAQAARAFETIKKELGSESPWAPSSTSAKGAQTHKVTQVRGRGS